jgi:hypothetical protein
MLRVDNISVTIHLLIYPIIFDSQSGKIFKKPLTIIHG